MSQRDHPYTVYQAVASRDQAAILIDHDHHRVRLGDGLAVLLTYHLLPLAEQLEPLRIRAVREYADRHPPVPPAVQAIIDQLRFEPE